MAMKAPEPIKTPIVDEIMSIRRQIADLKERDKELKRELSHLPGRHFLGKTHKVTVGFCRGSNRLSISALRRYVSAHVIEMASSRGKSHLTFHFSLIKDKK